MTPQKAIRLVHCCMHIGNNDILQAREMAILAIEKQIPKQTVPTSDSVFEFGNCPNCNAEFNSELVNEYKITHCPYCGQALDWGDKG